MFEDSKITKLTKDQFVEAESVAYLVNDERKRKLTFINTCALFAFKNYAEKNKYDEKPVTNINLFRVPLIAEKYGISDLYLADVRIDVRVSLDGKVFPIPACHIKDSLAPDFYVVYAGTKNPLKCEALGYIKKEDLLFDSQDSEYYYISVALLNPIEDLKKEIKNIEKEERTFYETEHKIASENFGAFLDNELDEIKSLDLIKHLLYCKECRGLFVEYSFLEDVLTAVKHYPDLKETVEHVLSETENQETVTQYKKEDIIVKEESTEDSLTDEDAEENQTEDDTANNGMPYIDFGEEADESFVDLSMSELTFDEDTAVENIPVENTNLGEEPYTIVENETSEYNTGETVEETNSDLIEVEEENTNEEEDVIEKIEFEEPADVVNTDENSSDNGVIEDMQIQTSVFDDEPKVELTDFSEDTDEPAIDEQNLDISFDNEISNILIEPDLPENDEDKSVELDIVHYAEDETNSISLDEVLINADNISHEAKEDLKNDEQLQKILSENTNDQTTISTNWNELFTNNSPSEKRAEVNLSENPVVAEEQQNDYVAEEIETLYDNKNSQENMKVSIEHSIEGTIETTSEKEKKSMNIVAVATITTILFVVAVAGIYFVTSAVNTFGNKNNPNDSSVNGRNLSGENYQNNLNRSMTNAFSGVEQTLNVTKLSWNKNKQATLTPELKEYMLTMGKMISDELDNNLGSVQGYIAQNPMKISILINKNGEIKKIDVSESCGSKEVDELLLQCVKMVIDKNQPSMYGVSGENINLTLVVNF